MKPWRVQEYEFKVSWNLTSFPSCLTKLHSIIQFQLLRYMNHSWMAKNPPEKPSAARWPTELYSSLTKWERIKDADQFGFAGIAWKMKRPTFFAAWRHKKAIDSHWFLYASSWCKFMGWNKHVSCYNFRVSQADLWPLHNDLRARSTASTSKGSSFLSTEFIRFFLKRSDLAYNESHSTMQGTPGRFSPFALVAAPFATGICIAIRNGLRHRTGQRAVGLRHSERRTCRDFFRNIRD